MNEQTGEIKRGDPEQLKKEGFTIPLTEAEAQTLEELAPADRLKAIENWKDKEKSMSFNNNVERSKVKFAFLEGIVTGRLM